ncbi:N-acetyltransferase [Bacillus cereus]|nr:N-acetyltransferase [Bacillus cereus]PWN80196.1 N-acetyltransferase [Bacillus cereus]
MKVMEYSIVQLTEKDWPQVSDIYLKGISTKTATFETECPDWYKWKMNRDLKTCIVAKVDQIIIGWASVSKISSRCAYVGVGETSVYVHPNYIGNNVGFRLLKELVGLSEENNYWTLQANIFAENISSIKIHEKNGFRIVGIREKIGQVNGIWKDNILMERRSGKIGR